MTKIENLRTITITHNGKPIKLLCEIKQSKAYELLKLRASFILMN